MVLFNKACGRLSRQHDGACAEGGEVHAKEAAESTALDCCGRRCARNHNPRPLSAASLAPHFFLSFLGFSMTLRPSAAMEPENITTNSGKRSAFSGTP